jgi:hypothetical protein
LKLRKALDITAQLPEQDLAAALRGDLLEAELPNEYIYGFRGRYRRGTVCRVPSVLLVGEIFADEQSCF